MRLSLMSALGVAVFASLGVLAASPAQAMSINNPVAGSTACTSFEYTFDGFAYDRDNYGDQATLSSEQATFRAIDGLGNVLYTNTVVQALMESNVPGTDYASVFTLAPVANPITFTITSEAGNGLPEEESLRLVSSCATIPSPATVTPAGFTIDIEDELIDTLAPFASEPNGFPLTFSLPAAPASGGLTLKPDGTFTYVPGTVGAHSFVVAVENKAGQSVELPVTITVTGNSDSPVVDPTENLTPGSTQERNEIAATGTESHAGLAVTGIAAGLLGLALMRPRRRA